MKSAFPLIVLLTAILLSGGILLLPALAAAADAPPFDKPPEPVGGMAAVMQSVSYPESALKDGTEGKVLLAIVIDTAGKVKSATVKEGVRRDLDQAALKAVRASRWVPAQKDGQAVEVAVVVPIQFKLEQKPGK